MIFQRPTTVGSDLTGPEHAAVRSADTSERAGLSAQEVAVRVQVGSTNVMPDRSSRSLWDIFRANVLTLFNAIVAGSFVLLVLLGQWRNALFGFAAVTKLSGQYI
ncbi:MULTISPECIES: cation-transporting P-type ATPase [unclassified Arthrobacter]|uniref:cation-transporting P-type ATPase n=1 Tax=unclassified Pseudarthrobacter TaxID=2647000 RepID=UPI0033978C5B